MAPTNSVFIPIPTILGDLISQVQANGSQITDFNTGSGARSLFEAFAASLSRATAVADQLQLDSHLDTATGAALDALGSDWLVPRNPAVQATGQLTITRQDTTSALTLKAGWSQLATTPAIPGQSGVAVLTNQDAVFNAGQAAATVTAQAVLGGQAGNLSNGVYLIPLAPINGISSQNGYQVTTAFTGGVDAESDDAYRTRIPITVQGRVKGRKESFLAAALGVPGVLSAGVLRPGDTRGDSSVVPAGSVEVYYQGSAGLLSQVQSAVANAATYTQNPSTFASISLAGPRGAQRFAATVTAWCMAGTDTVALGAAISTALQTYVNGAGIGGTAHISQAIDAILAIQGVVSLDIPPTKFNLFSAPGAADVTAFRDSYLNLAPADTNVTVNTLS